MGLIGCSACKAKDAELAFLRDQNQNLQDTLLAMTDAKAYSLRHPEKKAEPPQAGAPQTSPGRRPGSVLFPEPEMSAEQIEETFVLQEGLEAAKRRDIIDRGPRT